MRKNSQVLNRRGVTLLFVISMIVLFLLMGTTFVVVSNDFLRSSKQRTLLTVNDIASVGERIGDRFITQALYDLVRGPDLNNVNSPLRGHSILGDMYGYGLTGYVKSIENSLIAIDDATGTANDQQFLRLELIGANINVHDNIASISIGDFNTNLIGNDILTGDGIAFSDLGNSPGRFNGLLLSFVSGPMNGVSARIVDHQVFVDSMGMNPVHRFAIIVLNQPETFQVSAVQDGTSSVSSDLIVSYDDIIASNGTDIPTRVVINGRPFSGTGAGRFNPLAAPNAPALSAQANRPNRMGDSRETLYGNGNTDGYLSIGNGIGTARPNPFATNESYDAADEQNMYLAGIAANGNFLPSFHRPTLGMGASFRPEGTGGTITADSSRFPDIIDPATMLPYTFANRPLDVDHNGDGIRDGVWMDIGLPIYTTEDGRRVKPLVSYLVADLDGRININVHGNRSQLASNNLFTNTSTDFQALNPNALRGMGYGPAEVNLSRVFGDMEAERLMVGVVESMPPNREISGRYGFDIVPPAATLANNMGGGPAPGLPATMSSNGEDLFASYKAYGLPISNSAPTNPGWLNRNYQSSPMDIYGRMQLDFPSASLVASSFNLPGVPPNMPVGMPTSSVFTSTIGYSERYNSPYEVDFSPPGQQLGNANDQLFTLHELEQVFRRNDPDMVANTESRLIDLLAANNNNNHTLVNNPFVATTDSWEVPTTYLDFIGEPTNTIGTVQAETLTTKLYNILNRNGSNPNGIGINESNAFVKHELITAHLTGFACQDSTQNNFLRMTSSGDNANQFGLLSLDVRDGRPFNVNQPFGDADPFNDDGANDALDNIVDDPSETNELVPHPTGDKDFDYDNDSLVGVGDSYLARVQYARQLFVLTLLTTEVVDRNGNGTIYNAAGTDFDSGDFFDFDDDGDVDFTDRRGYRRVIAQWVANVVDYRDPDSIRTGIEFDLNPFDGWSVDGLVTTMDAGVTVPSFWFEDFWGVERPELLMTESIALHDTRTENLDTDDGDMSEHLPGDLTMDNDYDSRLVPQASTFIELYHPWVGGNQILPAEFDPNQTGVDLTQATPGNFPVWRIVAVRNKNLFQDQLMMNGSSENGYDPLVDDFDDLNLTFNITNDEIVRIIYFNQPPANGNPQFNGAKIFSPVTSIANNPQIVTPGNFAVIGSRGEDSGAGVFTTYLSRNAGHVNAPDGTLVDLARTRRIELDTMNDEVRVFRSDSITGPPESATNVRILPMVGPSVLGGPERSLGLSNPENNYWLAGTREFDVDPDGEGQVFVEPGTAVEISAPFDEPVDRTVDASFYDQVLVRNQLTNGAYILVLQRLADPLNDWDRRSNPYLTVDTMGCDLYSFNGIEGDSEDDMPDSDLQFFGSYERRSDKRMNNVAGQQDNNARFRLLWKTEFTGLNPTAADANMQMTDALSVPPVDVHALNRDLEHSFGEMNQAYVDSFPSMDPMKELPFAWLNWNNRPFANAYELTNVPYTSGSFLTSRFDASLIDSGVINDAYDMAPRSTGTAEDAAIRYTIVSGEFPHLLNFFNDDFQLFRMFDYMETPSRYVGTERYVNPDDYFAAATEHSISRGFAPPYDFVSNYRVPGKLNLNTIYDQGTWEALVGIDPNVTNSNLGRVSFMNWQNSRDMNPLRPAIASNRVVQAASTVVNPPVDSGLFRRQNNGDNPLFDYQLRPYTQDELNNTNRNAYYRFHERQRIANSVTTRSSVFAIWVAVGYFEVGELNGNTVVGREYEGGDFATSRNRGFFIVDRSIPVAFEPGKNHNIERAIRVSSFIE